jgi:pyruvate formate lyase activating enzyme
MDGMVYAAAYGRLAALQNDPVEKKPLFHYYPGSSLLSVGTAGCNLSCSFCQNWQLVNATPAPTGCPVVLPEEIPTLIQQAGAIGIAYTYNEPLTQYEWVYDTATVCRQQGLKNVLVSNGYINAEPLAELLPLIDAANIDVKAFTEEFYVRQCGGRLAPVLAAVEQLAAAAVHLEITTLLIPGENDSVDEIRQLSRWLAGINPAIPLHFSRYFPCHTMTAPATPLSLLVRAYEIAREVLSYVYIGNISESTYARTCCPRCGAVLIERDAYRGIVRGLRPDSACSGCGERIPIVQTT